MQLEAPRRTGYPNERLPIDPTNYEPSGSRVRRARIGPPPPRARHDLFFAGDLYRNAREIYLNEI